jgi:hypothetical protein
MIIRNAALSMACILACSAAQALERSTDGTGQAVLLPYYSAYDGFSTVFSVSNHRDSPKAVRVAIVEGTNGRVALTFNVYLAARDSWSGALLAGSATADAPPLLITSDPSCTSAPIPATGVGLRNSAYTGSVADGLGDDWSRLHEGQIEVIELGTLAGSAAEQAQAGDCAALRSRFLAGGAWAADTNADVGVPSGGLSAELQLVDVEDGVSFSLEPVVFEHFSGMARHANDFNAARIYKPTLAPGENEFIVDGGARVAASRPADAVSLSLMASRLEGPFISNDSIDASTEWVVSFPTWPAYVDNKAGGEIAQGEPLRAPFAASVAYQAGPYTCLPSEWRVIDRAGMAGAAHTLPLCGAVQVVSVTDAEALDLPSPRSLFTGVEAGRLRASFDAGHELGYSTANGAAKRHGLPVVATSLMRAVNNAARPGLLATYAITGRVLRDPAD